MRAWILILAAAAAALPGCTKPKPEGCESISCPAGQVCNKEVGACEPLAQCSSQIDCPAGKACIGGVCSGCSTNVVCAGDFSTCDPLTQKCAPCRSGADCPALFPVCTPDGCGRCRVDSDCAAPTPHCDQTHCVECNVDSHCGPGGTCQASGLCTASDECSRDLDCPTGMACDWGACREAPTGDECRTPVDLDLSSGSVTTAFWLETFLSNDDWMDWPSTDIYFRITLAQEAALNAELDTGDAFSTSASFLVLDGPCEQSTQLASGDPTKPLHDLYLAPGSYLVRVITFSLARSGQFTLHLWTTPASRAEGATCFKPIPIVLDAAGEATVTGDTRGLTNQLETPPLSSSTKCISRLPYALDLSVPSYVEAVLTPTDPAFHSDLRWGTGVSAEAACLQASPSGAPISAGQPRTITMSPAEAGAHVLVVDALEGTDGPFTLAVKVRPWMSNDRCATAAGLTFVDGKATASGDTNYAGNFTCGCSLSCWHHVAYRFSTVGLGERSIHVELVGSDPAARPQVLLDPDCGSVDQPLACDYHSGRPSALIDLPRLPEGEYFIQIGEENGHGFPFTLTVHLADSVQRPSNDMCATPATFDLRGGPASVMGDTRPAAGDIQESCDWATASPGLAYQVLVPGPGLVTLTVTPSDAAFNAILLANACQGTTTVSDCKDAALAGGAETWNGFVTGAFLAAVDGVGTSSGPFLLEGSYTPPPANDSCAAATAIAVGQTLNGDLRPASPSPENACNSPSFPSPDVFYHFAPGSNGTFTVKVTPSGFDAALGIVSNCTTSSTCVRTANAGGIGVAEQVTLSASKSSSYELVVQCLGGVCGSFTISAQ